MSPFIKNLIESDKLPSVRKCRTIRQLSQERVDTYAALHAKVKSVIEHSEGLMHRFIENPQVEDFDKAIKALSDSRSAVELQSKLAMRQTAAVEQIQRDPGVIDDLEAALREMLGEIDAVAGRLQKQERRAAQDSGVQYAGPSPTLKTLTESIRREYEDALAVVDSKRDDTNQNLFARFIHLVTA